MGSVMVARSNQIVFIQGYGLANREHDIPNAPNTKFRLGSITKQFIAIDPELQEQGKLSVDDPDLQIRAGLSHQLVGNQDPAPAHPHFRHSEFHQFPGLSLHDDAHLPTEKMI